jgi:hypothetical protein
MKKQGFLNKILQPLTIFAKMAIIEEDLENQTDKKIVRLKILVKRLMLIHR